MASEAARMPVAISRFDAGVETSRESQNERAIEWLLQQTGGPVTVVTPQKNFESDLIETLTKRSGVVHLTWKGLSTKGLSGRILFVWPRREHLNDLWGVQADALAVIELNPDETQEWIEDHHPLLLLHDRTEPYTSDESESRDSDPFPNDVDEILEHIADMAAGYSSGLKWNETEKLKADMMNRPERWASATVDQVRAKCKKLGMSPNDADEIAGLLQRRKDGHSFRVRTSYRNFHFKD